jgi:cytochrome c oxidase subunit 3
MENAMTQGYPSRNRIHPHKFALWVACASIVMMFSALTSAYIVRKAAGNWLEFELPNIFYWNTLVILASSVTLHGAYIAFQRGWEKAYAPLLGITFLLGLAFLGLQYEGWQAMVEQGIPLKTNPSGDFIYVISGIHGAHVLGGLAALAVSFGLALIRPFQQTPVRKLRLELVLTYWHFVDFLWLYLLVFWIIQG